MKKINVLSFIVIFITLLYPPISKCQVQDVQKVESELLKKASQNIEIYRKSDAVISFKTSSGNPLQNAKVEIKQKTHDFLFGNIIFDLINNRGREPYKPEIFKQRFKELFNYAVFPFYWGAYEPTPGMPNWQSMLPVIEWCKSNGITTKGHPLVWTYPAGVPKWLSRFPITLTEELLKARLINTVSGFEGKIDIWDVVNEPVNTRAWRHTDAKLDEMGHFKEPIKDAADFTEMPLRWAYTGNPKSHLIVNEYGQIIDKTIRERFIELIKELQSRNTPISGLGIQAHLWMTDWFNPKDLFETYDELSKLGYPLHITEFIPQSSGKEITGNWRKGKWTLETQAEFTEQFYRLSFGHPAVISINWWGLSDRNIWQKGGGLITEEYEPKPVYNRLKKLIHEEWNTNLLINTDKNGEIKFRGFYGKYDVILTTDDGKIHSFDIHLNKNEENKWIFTIK